MPELRRTTWLLSLAVIVLSLVCCLARPAPLTAGTEITSDVVGSAGGQASSSSYAIHDTFGQGPIGPVATDTDIQLYDGFWSTLAVAAPDTEPPMQVVSFEAMALDREIFLEWTNPSDSDFAGTRIRFSDMGFPEKPDDGAPVWGAEGDFPGSPGSEGTYSHVSLTNGTRYYYTAFAYDLSRNYSEAVSDSGTPFDGVPPGGVTLQLPEPGDMSVTLRWTNPSEADFNHTLIRVSTDSFPQFPGDGGPVESPEGKFFNSPGSADSVVHTGLVNGTRYYYAFFAGDEVPNYSFPQTVSEIPQDVISPADVVMATAQAQADGSIEVRWRAADDDDIEGVLVRYSTITNPVLPTDGEPVPNETSGKFDMGPGESGSYMHTGLVHNLTYYYTVFTYDEVPNYSEGTWIGTTAQDQTPPGLSLSVFQNPYLTNYLDIYLVGGEALVDTSVYCAVNGDEIDMDLADGREYVWRADYDLHGTGTDSIYARARDVNLNLAEVTYKYSSTLVLLADGGVAGSVDGRLAVSIPPGALKADSYILIFEEACEASEVARRYRVSPPGLPLDGYAEISIGYDNGTAVPEHLAVARIEGETVTPVESYLDENDGRILAYVDRLGTYGLIWRADIHTPAYGKGSFSVLQNVPNPFAGSTSIIFEIPRTGTVRADVVTIDGRLVRDLCRGIMIPGRHDILWDGRDARGQRVASGVYFYRVRFDGKTITRKMVHLR
jgi:hypothetical protein